MSTFLSYEPITGALVGGFTEMSTRERGGQWVRLPSPSRPVTPCWTAPGKLAWIVESGEAGVRIIDTDGNTYKRGSNWLYGGGGRWVGCHAVNPALIYAGMERTITGPRGVGQHSVGKDGTLAYCLAYHDGKGMVVEDANGVELPGSRNLNIPVSHSVCIDRNAVVCYAAADMRHVWFWNGTAWSRHRIAYRTYEGQAIRWKGEIWLVYTGGEDNVDKSERIVIHKLTDPTMGYKVGWYNSGQDGCYNGNGWVDPVTEQLWVAWSTTQGAGLRSIKEQEIVGAPVRLPGTEPTPVPETSFKFGRPIFLGAYDALKPLETTPRLIGNVAFPWKERVRECPLPLILAHDTLPYDADGDKWSDYAGILNRTLYYYVHCGGAGLSTGKIQWDKLMLEPEKPVILYLDSRNWPSTLPSWVNKDRTLLGVQCYPEPTEDVDEFRVAMTTLFDKLKTFGLPLVLTPCFYDRNGTLNIAQVMGHMPTYEYLVNKYQVVGIMPFSDQRADGMQKYPQLYDVMKRWADAIPARPNRYQWWTPGTEAEEKRALKDLVSYDIAGFSPAQKETLHGLIDAM